MDRARLDSLNIILVCGLPGSGKSHFSKKYFQDTDRRRINRKEIRRHLYEMLNFGRTWSEDKFNETDEFLVKHVERKTIEHLLQARQRLLVDNTSVTRSSRQAYVSLAQRMHCSIGVVFLNTPVKLCLERNAQQADSVPGLAVTNLAAALELPTENEGFREIVIVENY
ncbi:MAG: ATP-binding protein [Spirochaetales bacterium]|nr:ATP-binding protein [Spirochaetales bacterium]